MATSSVNAGHLSAFLMPTEAVLGVYFRRNIWADPLGSRITRLTRKHTWAPVNRTHGSMAGVLPRSGLRALGSREPGRPCTRGSYDESSCGTAPFPLPPETSMQGIARRVWGVPVVLNQGQRGEVSLIIAQDAVIVDHGRQAEVKGRRKADTRDTCRGDTP